VADRRGEETSQSTTAENGPVRLTIESGPQPIVFLTLRPRMPAMMATVPRHTVRHMMRLRPALRRPCGCLRSAGRRCARNFSRRLPPWTDREQRCCGHC